MSCRAAIKTICTKKGFLTNVFDLETTGGIYANSTFKAVVYSYNGVKVKTLSARKITDDHFEFFGEMENLDRNNYTIDIIRTENEIDYFMFSIKKTVE